MRLSGIVQSKQMLDFRLRESKAEFVLNELEPSFDLFHPELMPVLHNILYGGAVRIITVTEDVIMPQFIPA